MFVDRKTQYHQDVSSQLNLWIPHILSQNLGKLFCRYQQTDSKVYMERQKTHKSQYDTEEEQSQGTDITWMKTVRYS